MQNFKLICFFFTSGASNIEYTQAIPVAPQPIPVAANCWTVSIGELNLYNNMN